MAMIERCSFLKFNHNSKDVLSNVHGSLNNLDLENLDFEFFGAFTALPLSLFGDLQPAGLAYCAGLNRQVTNETKIYSKNHSTWSIQCNLNRLQYLYRDLSLMVLFIYFWSCSLFVFKPSDVGSCNLIRMPAAKQLRSERNLKEFNPIEGCI